MVFVNGFWRGTGSVIGSALVDRLARSSHRLSRRLSMSSGLFAAMVVSSFSPVGCPVPTKNPATSKVTLIIVLREYVANEQGTPGERSE